MPLDRDEVIDALAALAAPLGPFTTLEERLSQQDQWVEHAAPELLDVLADIAATPPAAERFGDATMEDAETLLVEVAARLGKQDPDRALAGFVPLLRNVRARPIAIEVLGGVGDGRAVDPLGQLLLGENRLGDDERVRIAGALGEIGGEEACRLLRQMRAKAGSSQTEIASEIEIALKLAGYE